MAVEPFRFPAPTVGATPSQGWENWWANTLASALRSGTSEMVGLKGDWLTPITGVSPEETAAFRSDNPIASIGSQIVGALPTYVAGVGLGARVASRALPSLWSAEAAATRPFATAAGRAAAEIAPLEAARLSGAALMGGDLESVAASAGLDVAGNVGFGLAGQFFRTLKSSAGGTQEQQIARMVDGYQVTLPAQVKLRQLQTLRDAGTIPQEAAKGLDEVLEGLRREVRTETPGARIDALLEGADEKTSRAILGLFEGRGGKNLDVRRFYQGVGQGFPDRAAWQGVLDEVGLPQNWEMATQFPRLVTARTDAEAKRLLRLAEGGFTKGHGGWYVKRFQDEDMFVVARRLPGGGSIAAGGRPSGLRSTDGWKLHLDIDEQLGNQIGQWLKSQNIPFKVGQSGGQAGKGMTIYAGSRAAADALAAQLPQKFSLPRWTAKLPEDTAFNPHVQGRFDVSGDKAFHQYGLDGVPILADDVRSAWGTPAGGFTAANKDKADALLRQRYGEFYTGTPTPTTSGVTAGDRWFVGLTNRPEALIENLPMLRRAERLSTFVAGAENKSMREAIERLRQADPDNVASFADELDKAVPWRATRVGKSRGINDAIGDFLPESLRNVAKEYRPAAAKLWQETKNVLAPAMSQFYNSPMAKQMIFKSAAVYRKGVERTQKALYGAVDLGDASPGGKLLRPHSAPGGLLAKFDPIQESEIGSLQRVISKIENGDGDFETLLTQAMKELDNPGQRAKFEPFLRELKAVQDRALAHHNSVASLVGEKAVEPLANRVFPHMWGGNFRWRLLDEQGGTRYMAWGRTQDEVRREAGRLAEKLGLRKDARGPFTTTREEDLTEAFDLLRQAKRADKEKVGGVVRPDILMKPRQGVGGYMFDPEGPALRKQELWDIIESGVHQTDKRTADMTVKRMIVPKLADVEAAYGRSVANGVVQRINSLSGRQGDFAAWQNKAVEKFFPGWGKNGATKLAYALNQFETHMNLLSGNMMYVMQNAMTALHTIAPEIALLRSLPVGQWARFYDVVPQIGADGVKGAAFVLNPMKLLKDGGRALRNPTAEERKIFERAVRDRTIAPSFIEQEVGSKSRRALSLKRIAAGEQSLWQTAKDMMELPAVKVEELTRAHALMIGTKIGQAVGLKDEALYQFASQFTNRTMFGYSVADRPRLFTGPIGSVFGLFKNWTTHYLSNWGTYAGEAFMRGNFSPLLWASSGVAATGGIGALPFVAGLEAFRRFNDNRGLMESYYEAFNGRAPERLLDAAWYGLPAFMGISMQANTAAPLNDPTRDITFMTNAMILDRARRIAQLGGEAWEAWKVGGENPLMTDRTWDRMWYALSPRTTYKAFAQVEDGAMRAMNNGAPIYEGVTQPEYIANTLGLTPIRMAKVWDASRQIWEDRNRASEVTAAFGRQLAYAYLRNDQVAMNRLLGEAIAANTDVSSVMASMQRNLQAQLVPQMTRNATSLEAMRLLDTLGLAGGGV